MDEPTRGDECSNKGLGHSNTDETDREPLLIQINIHGNFIHSSTRVKISPTLTAGSVCGIVSEKVGILEDDLNFFTLVVVYTCPNRSKVQYPRPLHLVRTLKSSDFIMNIIKEKEKKTPATKEDMYTTKWYFKEIRTPPLNFDGDVSGDSSSDDEEDVPVNFLSYLRQSEETGRTGYLLKRSASDPNLWRKRLCLLTDFHMWFFHARNRLYKGKKIDVHGPIYLQDDLLPLEYPLGFGVKAGESNFFFRAFDEEDQTIWISELIEYCKNEESNHQIHMADVLISLEENERNRRCSDSFKSLLSDNLMSWLKDEISDRSDGERDNKENLWTIHSFHSYHPLCGKAIGFIVAVNEEYKGLFRKFIRPTSAVFWDCVIEIYKRYIVSQIMPVHNSKRRQSLCFPEKQIPADFSSAGAITFYDPSYLEGAEASTVALQEILENHVRWKKKEEILEETAFRSSVIAKKGVSAVVEGASGGGWFSGWIAPKPVIVDYNSELDKDAHGSSTSELRSGKASRHYSKRYACMGESIAPNEIYVSDYILLNGHDSVRPELNLFDGLVEDVTRWLNSKEAKNH